jgi:hypothetical protein
MNKDLIPNDLEKELYKLVGEETVPQVFQAFSRIVTQSFIDDRRNLIVVPATRDEVRRRFRICIKYFLYMKGDLYMSTRKSIDHLPKALRCDLDNAKWVPPTSGRMWVPEKLNKFGHNVG